MRTLKTTDMVLFHRVVQKVHMRTLSKYICEHCKCIYVLLWMCAGV